MWRVICLASSSTTGGKAEKGLFKGVGLFRDVELCNDDVAAPRVEVEDDIGAAEEVGVDVVRYAVWAERACPSYCSSQ